jgi:cyclohexadienyl dehydratase
MKKMRLGITATVAASLWVAACSAGADHDITHAALRVCSTGDYRPFSYRDSRGFSGMDIDLAHDLADHLGKQLDLVETTWPTLLDDLGAKCDLAMGGITVTPQRGQRALFSAPYLRDGKAAIVRCADAARFSTLAAIDQPGVRVVVNPGGTNAQFDKTNLHRASVIEYPDNNTIFEQIVTNDADVMITDASEIRWETTQDPQLCGVAVDTPFTTEEKAYLIARSDPALLQRVNDWLATAQKDGTYARIAQQWLGRVVGP